MLLSRNFLKDYVDIDVDTLTLAEDMTNVGNEYDKLGQLIEGTKLVTGLIKECKMHPDSDHLHICKVDIGTEIIDIVCGAPNAKEGLYVIVALSGCILPGGVIKSGKIRGMESNGMMCSLQELGIDKKYLTEKQINGIEELPKCELGIDPRNVLNMDDSYIDFELTSNRGDLLSIMGMAYEVGAIYNKPVKDINLDYKKEKGDFKLDLSVNTDKCPLFLARLVKNVKIEESPEYIKNRLIASGIRPINNVVDISNYVMLETGQPLHFYDYDKLNNKLEVRQAKDNEELITLDNEKRILDKSDIVITSNDTPIGLAGVMGGLSTEVTEDTKNILIESAIFDGISIRLTSKKILRSEASNRFEKGLDANRTYTAIERAAKLLNEICNGTVIEERKEYSKVKIEEKVIEIDISTINNILGLNIEKEEIINIYKRLGFLVKEEKDKLIVTVPTRRIDISIKEDLVEEISRIYGLDNVIGRQPILPIKKGSYDVLKRNIRERLINSGLCETLSYTLIKESEVHKYTLDNFEHINLLDPMTDDRKTLRYSIIPSLMMINDYNQKRNNKDVLIFEIGKSFGKIDNNYVEKETLGILLTGNIGNSIYSHKVTFYHLKGIIENLLDSLGYKGRYSFKLGEFPKEYHPGSTAIIELSGKNIGYIGKVHPNETKKDIFVAEINIDTIRNIRAGNNKFKELSKFPSITKDVAFLVDKKVTNEEIINSIKKIGGRLLTNIELFDYYVGDNIDNNKKSLAYNLTFNKEDSTLTEDEVMPLFNDIIDFIKKKFYCEVRDK